MTTVETNPDRILRKKYILALSIIACLVIFSQSAIQFLISKNEDDSRVINIAGRQRMLGQRINKCAFGLYMTEDPANRVRYRVEMAESLKLWEKSQRGLQNGNAEMGLPGNNSDKVKELFARIQPKFNLIVRATTLVLAQESGKGVDRSLLKNEIQAISHNEDGFLKGMDKIVFQYDREARAKVELVRKIELCLMAITFFVLFMEALFIFRPAEKQIKEIMNKFRENEDSIADAKEEFKAIFENSQVGMVLLKQYRQLHKGNQRLADILGYGSPDEMTGMSVLQVHLSMEHFEEFGSKYYDSLTKGEQIQVEYQLKRKDGSPVWCTLSGKAIDGETPPDLNKGVLWVIDDISGRKVSEEHLRQSLEFIDTLIKSMPFGFIIVGKDKRILDINQAALDMVGRSAAEEIVGTFCHETLCPAGRYLCPLLDLGQCIDRSERILIHMDGSHIPIYKTVTPITLNNREVFLEAFIDISEQKAAQDRFRRASIAAEAANIAKSEFLARMSHELRTPLNAILGFTGLMARDESLSESARKNLAIVNRSGEHLLSMINDVLDLSKIEAGKMELKEVVFDLPGMVEDVAGLIRFRAGAKGLEFIVQMDPRLENYVRADMGKLRQVLINLLGNAVKFTDEGNVTLRVRTTPSGENPGRRFLELEVQDTGTGIPRDKLDAIFDSFAQAAPHKAGRQGTGLGLTISRSFVCLMKGEIAVESEAGKGSLFRVRIPVEPVPGGMVPQKGILPLSVIGLEADEPDWRVLIVDDNPDNIRFLEALLTRTGFSVRTAGNGPEGIAIVSEWHPHFIWMDMNMPVMDGYDATRRIRKLPCGADVVIFALTACVYKDDEQMIRAAGCNGVIYKPYREREIFEVMARHLGIRYRYNVSEAGNRTSPSLAEQPQSPTDVELETLPPDTARRIRQAAVKLNKRELLAIAEEIETAHPAITDFLKKHVVSFDFESIERGIKLTEGEDQS
jgi:PAS domain S-box-containing protein